MTCKMSCSSRYGKDCNCPVGEDTEVVYELELDEATVFGAMSAAGVLGVFTVLAVVAKAFGFVTWPWWYVLAPVWGPVALVPVVFVVTLVVSFIRGFVDAIRDNV
jgi:hypothetical protein